MKMSFWSTTHIKKARKDHDCIFCQLQIKKGTSYYKEAGLCGGDFSAYKIHPECKFYVEAVERSDGEEFYYFSPFKEQRSVPYTYAMAQGDDKLKAEIKKNLEIEMVEKQFTH